MRSHVYLWKLKISKLFPVRMRLILSLSLKGDWEKKEWKLKKKLQMWYLKMEMCSRHLLESVNGKRQLVFPSLDCVRSKLLRTGPMLSFHLVIFNFNFFFFLKRMFICFLMKMIYINNKHCEKSADAARYRITWKNNDERHQALMRHLELHIKRQPGVFLHSLGNWCLSLMPCASLRGWRLWFG